MHLMALGQHRNVVAPVVGGGAEAVHQQDGRAHRIGRAGGDGVDGMTGVAPGLGVSQGSHHAGHRGG